MSTAIVNQFAIRTKGEESGLEDPQNEKQESSGFEELPAEIFDDHDV
jgi:hypothetical protein